MALENLIFDLGGVLYTISPDRSVAAFNQLMGGGSEALIWEAFATADIWKKHECGLVGDAAFRAGIRGALDLQCGDEEIDAAWNALLVEPKLECVEWLKRLQTKYQLVLLSNTNAIHFRHLQPGAKALLDCFEQLFLSFEMGCRKPEAKIYEMVLGEMGWQGESCLFFDDSKENKMGAESVGIPTVCVGGERNPSLLEHLKQNFSTI